MVHYPTPVFVSSLCCSQEERSYLPEPMLKLDYRDFINSYESNKNAIPLPQATMPQQPYQRYGQHLQQQFVNTTTTKPTSLTSTTKLQQDKSTESVRFKAVKQNVTKAQESMQFSFQIWTFISTNNVP